LLKKLYFPIINFSRNLLLVFILLCVYSNAYGKQEFYPFVAEVKGENVNIRSGQSSNFESLGRVQLKQKVVVVDKSFSWYKIELPKEASSFVFAEYVILSSEGRGKIIANRVNVRSGPGERHTVLGQLNMGDDIAIIENQNGWLKIEPLKSSFGWILDKFLIFKSKNVSSFRKKEKLLDKSLKIKKTAIVDKEKEGDVKLPAETGEVHAGKKKKETKVEKKETPPVGENTYKKKVAFVSVEIKEESMWTEFYKLNLLKKDKKTYVSAKGYLHPQKKNKSEGIQYQFMVNGKVAFYVKGFNQVLAEFLKYKVKIEGELVSEKKDRDSDPIVKILKIQLEL